MTQPPFRSLKQKDDQNVLKKKTLDRKAAMNVLEPLACIRPLLEIVLFVAKVTSKIRHGLFRFLFASVCSPIALYTRHIVWLCGRIGSYVSAFCARR